MASFKEQLQAETEAFVSDCAELSDIDACSSKPNLKCSTSATSSALDTSDDSSDYDCENKMLTDELDVSLSSLGLDFV